MRAIAAEAGVAVATLEQQFATKARLLKAAIDVAIAGDDEAVPVLDRSGSTPRCEHTYRQRSSSPCVAEVIAAAQHAFGRAGAGGVRGRPPPTPSLAALAPADHRAARRHRDLARRRRRTHSRR